MIKAIIAGAGGRMGGRIVQLINETQDMTVVGAFEKAGSPFGRQRSWGMAGNREQRITYCLRS